ncbi:MAG: carboxypeptidase-like regulatory domain-containing protein [Planctomycetia bacterium]|nr:carboxypeptidase-like regulatory domain-containing protein [Planctomycetia bacterium]
MIAGNAAVAAQPPKAEPLPWQPDYAAAVAKAQAQHQHMVVLLAAPNSDACRRLETEALTAALIREGLADMVWVRVVGDADLERQLGTKEHPTLAFVNPFTGGVLHRTSGEKTVELLAREIVHARRAIGLDLTAGLKEVAARMFSFDGERAEKFVEAGDAKGLLALLAPSAKDDSRQANYLVATISLPAGMEPDQVRFLAGTDCLVGSDATADGTDPTIVAARLPELVESCTEHGIPESGLVLVPCERAAAAEVVVRITAPGCRLISDTIRFVAPAPEAALQMRHYDLRPLADADASQLSGRVRKPDGGPAAAAIVRIEDWYETARGDATTAVPAVVRTDADGRFTFPRVSPGRWLVRAESPGGECEQVIDLAPGKDNACDLTLRAVTTVGLRWTLQTRELSQDFAGPGAQTGEAFFSVSSSRITLARGMRLRMSEACDLMLAQTPLDDDSLPAKTRQALAALPAGIPVWYLVDTAYTAEFLPLSGLHRDPRPFALINTVSAGDPLPDQEWEIIGPILPQALDAARERENYFELVRGEPVRSGDVFTLRCTMRNCFAKLEVTDVTIVTPESR